MQRCVIVGGAEIITYQYLRKQLRQDDYIIYCDCGLKHQKGLEKEPDLIVGDFDSYANPGLTTETIILPREKDDTDTVFAAKTAVERGFRDFILLGVTEGRLDHTFGNLGILLWLQQQGASAQILGNQYTIEVVAQKPVYVAADCRYFSLLCMGEPAKGVNIRHAKFPLTDAVITSSYQYGISNEVIPGCRAEVFVREGCLLLYRYMEDNTWR